MEPEGFLFVEHKAVALLLGQQPRSVMLKVQGAGEVELAHLLDELLVELHQDPDVLFAILHHFD